MNKPKIREVLGTKGWRYDSSGQIKGSFRITDNLEGSKTNPNS